MNLPFGLNQKPIRRYFGGHSTSFRSSKGKLFCLVTKTTKVQKTPLFEFEIKSKEQLDKILKVCFLYEIISIRDSNTKVTEGSS